MSHRFIKSFLKILFIFTLFLSLTSSTKASDCPRGLVDDPAPGICGLYTDKNNDQLCDLSEESIAPLKTTAVTVEKVVVPVPVVTKDYHMWELTLVLTIIYLFSIFLVKKGYLSKMVNRKIWNILLLLTFVITAITSIFVLLRLNYGLIVPAYLDLVYWHIEVGYVMILISIYHTLWHLAYLKSCFVFRK